MRFRQLVALLPCGRLEDLPVDGDGQATDGLLAAWTALWHPCLLAATGSTPTWHPADAPPEPRAERLIVVPQVSEEVIPAEWTDRAAGNPCVVRGVTSQAAALAATAAVLRDLDGGQRPVDPELVADFHALGYAWLMVERLTREMHSASYVDESRFEPLLTEAASAAVRGEGRAARDGLTGLFDLLLEARDHYYPVDAYLVDLTLLASTTPDASVHDDLASNARHGTCTNLVAAGEVIERMATQAPGLLRAVRQGLDGGTVALVGGPYAEQGLSLWDPESVLASLARGRQVCEQHLGRPVTLYGDRQMRLSPILPQILNRLGFHGALHSCLDGTPLPDAPQCKIRWEGLDGSAIDALASVPLDARRPESLLGFSHRLSRSMDRDYVATLSFAHWPGEVSPWYDILRRVARYGPVLGKFVTLDHYFATTEAPDLQSRFEPDQYRVHFPERTGTGRRTDPVSRHVRAQTRAFASRTADTLAALTTLAGGRAAGRSDRIGLGDPLALFAAHIAPGRPGAAPGTLAVNPFSHSRFVPCNAPPPAGSARRRWTRGTRPGRDHRASQLEVPALGFAWCGLSGAAWASSPEPASAAQSVVENEFLAVRVSPVTGAIEAVYDRRFRGNQLSQRLAFRYGDRAPGSTAGDRVDGGSAYSHMVASSIARSTTGPDVGEITSRGFLQDEAGTRLADFEQKVRLARCSRIVELEIVLTPVVMPGADPWESYYAARFAWPDADAAVARSVGMTRQKTRRTRIDGAHFVEVRGSGPPLVILPGGLPFHRRSGTCMLDTLLLVRGETARQFRLGVGVGVAQPARAALDFMVPPTRLRVDACRPPAATSGWFFHIDRECVIVTHLEPVFALGGAAVDATTGRASGPAGIDDRRPRGQETPRRVAGFRLRLLETAGQAGRVHVRAFRHVRSATQTDFLGQTLAPLSVQDDTIGLDLNPYEWVQLEAAWEQTK